MNLNSRMTAPPILWVTPLPMVRFYRDISLFLIMKSIVIRSMGEYDIFKGPYRLFRVFWPTILIQWTHIFGLKLFLVHKNIFLSKLFYF